MRVERAFWLAVATGVVLVGLALLFGLRPWIATAGAAIRAAA